jgi:hypothetical protein
VNDNARPKLRPLNLQEARESFGTALGRFQSSAAQLQVLSGGTDLEAARKEWDDTHARMLALKDALNFLMPLLRTPKPPKAEKPAKDKQDTEGDAARAAEKSAPKADPDAP